MILNISIPKFRKVTLAMIAIMTLLVACAPNETAKMEPATADMATTATTLSSTETATVTITTAPTFTATPSTTPTATLSPEEAAETAQAAIRAEVLSYGINLDDLARSENEYIRNHPGITDTFQEDLDSSFGKSGSGSATMIVLEVEQLQSVGEYEQAFITDGGWKFRAWTKVAYKNAAGDWAIANLPLDAYNENTQELWRKMPQNTGPLIYKGITYEGVTLSFHKGKTGIIDWFQEAFQDFDNFYLNTGAIFRLNVAYPDPEVKLNSGEVGEAPRFSEEEMAEFRQTGDPSLFDYQLPDGTYVIWPFVNYDAISHIDYQIP